MGEISCSLCGRELKDKDATYALTPGIIDENCGGFRMNLDSEWDLYCADCINEIDRLVSDFRQNKSK